MYARVSFVLYTKNTLLESLVIAWLLGLYVLIFNSFCSMYTPQPMAPINGVANITASRPPSASAVASVTPTQPGKEYDFSSLTQGMFTKR